MASVKLLNIHKKFNKTVVIPNLNLVVNDQEFVVFVGPSGCGKTSTLRIIAGLEESTAGSVFISNTDVTHLKPGSRNCAMVFQNYALYPHMSVRQNITYGMKVRGVSLSERNKHADDVAGILGISNLMERRPKNLSGGQRQRVAIGRALVRKPDVFLFDEPLSNLDAKLRISMRAEIKNLHHKLKNTIVYVTHDQVEAMTLADRVVVMNKGEISQVGEPIELYEKPGNLFVAGFIGSPTMNFFNVTVINDRQLYIQFKNKTQLLIPDVHQEKCKKFIDQECIFGIRPEHLSGGEKGAVTMEVLTQVVEPIGQFSLVIGEFNGEKMTIQIDPHLKMKPFEMNTITVDMSKMHLFDKTSEQSLL